MILNKFLFDIVISEQIIYATKLNNRFQAINYSVSVEVTQYDEEKSNVTAETSVTMKNIFICSLFSKVTFNCLIRDVYEQNKMWLKGLHLDFVIIRLDKLQKENFRQDTIVVGNHAQTPSHRDANFC